MPAVKTDPGYLRRCGRWLRAHWRSLAAPGLLAALIWLLAAQPGLLERFQLERLGRYRWLLAGTAAFLGAVYLIGPFPTRYVQARLSAAGRKTAGDAEIFQLETQVRDVLLKALGGLLALGSAWLGWLQFSQQQAAEQYARAVELISAERAEQRVAGAYLLGVLAEKDPAQYHWRMMEHCVALLRQVALRADNPADGPEVADSAGSAPPDVQAALNVLGRRRAAADLQFAPEYWQEQAGTAMARALGPEVRMWLDLSHCDLSHANLNLLDLRGALFYDARFTGASLYGARLEHAALLGAELGQARLSGAQLQGALLDDAHLEYADLGDATLEGASFIGAVLYEADLNDAKLRQASLRNARLAGSSARFTDFSGACLQAAVLDEADLQGADFSAADLSSASLKGASLISARLDGASLEGCDFSGASLYGASLAACDLRKALGLTPAMLSEAESVAGAKLPRGLAVEKPDAPAR